MKIFEFQKIGKAGNSDWIFAIDKEDAIEFYLGFTGLFRSDLNDYKITEIPKDKWSENYILDISDIEPCEFGCEDYNEDDYFHGFKIIETFAEYAERNTCTDIIATTDY